ncbi:MAG: GldG family protein [Gammaproteobacteria bacterium]|nr:GldG family protein [Gammaproteobacteria bacterium]
MRVNRHSRNQLRLQDTVFYLVFALLIGLLAYLSHRHTLEWDWTLSQRNTLSAASVNLLNSLDKPLSITVFASENESVRAPIIDLINRYQRAKDKIDVQWINPELEPALIRELGINEDGTVIIHYGERSEKLSQHNEQAYSNAIQRLARSEERWLVFLSGHGERNLLGQANHDLGEWGKRLKTKGFKLQPLNLAEQPAIPDNTAALIIASPQVDYLSGEVEIIRNFIKQGGNLLWLMEPGPLHGLQPLADLLQINFFPGTIVDASTQLVGIDDPRIALVSQYPKHPLTQNFEVLTLFPQARAIFVNDDGQADTDKDNGGWQKQPFLLTMARSWVETGELSGQIEFDKESDIKGPLVIGLTLSRSLAGNPQNHGANPSDPQSSDNAAPAKQQRVAIIGDGDFLSNTYVGNGGNMDLGLHIANWLSHDDQLINIPVKTSGDVQFQLSKSMQILIAFGFLLLIPLVLAGSGFGIWWQRRKR